MKVILQHIPFILENNRSLESIRKDYTEIVCFDEDGYYFLSVKLEEGDINKLLVFDESVSDDFKKLEEKYLRKDPIHRIYLN